MNVASPSTTPPAAVNAIERRRVPTTKNAAAVAKNVAKTASMLVYASINGPGAATIRPARSPPYERAIAQAPTAVHSDSTASTVVNTNGWACTILEPVQRNTWTPGGWVRPFQAFRWVTSDGKCETK